MSSNLAEIYSYVKNVYRDYDVIYNNPISYLETITNPTNKYIFICKQDPTRLNTLDFLPERNSVIKSSNENLDLTGSPLKDNVEIESLDITLEKLSSDPWNYCEASYTAIKLSKARNILCDFELQKIGKDSSSSIWILCDATDEERTIALNLDFECGKNSRGIVYYKGCLPINKVDLNEMLKIHSRQIHIPCKIETSIESFFYIKPNITLKLSWNSSAQKPILNNYKNSDVTLYQSIKVNDTGSVAEDFWRQLQFLSILKDDILQYKNEVGSVEPVYRCINEIDLDILREKIITTITDLPAFCDVNSTTTEIEAVIQNVKMREPLDVTDKLWELLKCCSCYKDLKLAFQHVFHCAATCNIVNMPHNQNRLAEIIREVSQRRLAIPCLVGTEPMELLLEIGIEKITKDYESIFTESKICGTNDLKIYMGEKNLRTNSDLEKSSLNIRKSLYNTKPAESKTQRKTALLKYNSEESVHENGDIGFQNSRFNQKMVEHTLAKLTQIHFALEHLLLIQINLNLENVYNQILKELMQNPVKSFNKVINDVYDKIEIPITTDKILHHLENKDPHARRIVMSSETNFNEFQSTFYYSMDYIFPPHIFEGIPSSDDDREITKESTYHHWYYLKIKSRRF